MTPTYTNNPPPRRAPDRVALVAVLAVALTHTSPAFAYIDPGLGTTIVTAILGLIAAIGYTFRSYLAKLRQFFSRDSNDHENR